MSAPMGSGAVTGANAAGSAGRAGTPVYHTAQTSGGQPAQADYTGPGVGALKLNPVYLYNLIKEGKASDASQAVAMARGLGRPLNRLAKFGDNLYGQALQMLIGIDGVGGNNFGPDVIEQYLNAINTGGLQGLLTGAANNVMGTDFTGMDNDIVNQALSGGAGLNSLFTGNLGAAILGDNLDRLDYDLMAKGIASGGQYRGNLGEILQGSPFQQAMARFKAASGR